MAVSKVYSEVPAHQDYINPRTRQLAWSYPAAKFLDENGSLTSEYLKWRTAGMNNSLAVRRPNPKAKASSCLGALTSEQLTAVQSGQTVDLLDYVSARKQIYITEYAKAVQQAPLYSELLKLWEKKQKLIIAEVDVAYQEDLPYYREKYGVPEDWISS